MNILQLRSQNGNQSTIPLFKTPPQRDGRFDVVVGKASSVDDHMSALKQKHDPYGQLCLSANVVESTDNLQIPSTQDASVVPLLNYIDFNNKTRNGRLGEDAAFVYPLRQPPNASISSKDHFEVGVYADGKDLNTFLNFVGEDSWNDVVNQSPDRITDFALQYAASVQTDSLGDPIVVEQLDPPPSFSDKRVEESSANSRQESGGFLNFFA